MGRYRHADSQIAAIVIRDPYIGMYCRLGLFCLVSVVSNPEPCLANLHRLLFSAPSHAYLLTYLYFAVLTLCINGQTIRT